MLAKKTSKNQLTLPKEIVGNFPGVDLFDAVVENHRIVLTPVKVTPLDASLDGIRDKIRKLGIDENDVSEAVKWARS
ncbi:MAG: AbrB/MazE/SpoVT family DNA-binding domain-containing protein [Pseudomonadota bacterium]|nr:AbrB/MazE/SpoVT family DNA-binding domain-containing protein [Deltaproteobacteria bacterium]